MLAVIQRVASAHIEIAGERIAEVGRGLLVLVCAQPHDTAQTAQRFVHKLLRLRIFADDAGKMNRSVQDLDGAGMPGGVLLVSQFTLAADTQSGTRPGFSRAAEPGLARRWFEDLVAQARAAHPRVAAGRFGADMQVHLINDGPVTLPMQL